MAALWIILMMLLGVSTKSLTDRRTAIMHANECVVRSVGWSAACMLPGAFTRRSAPPCCGDLPGVDADCSVAECSAAGPGRAGPGETPRRGTARWVVACVTARRHAETARSDAWNLTS